MIRFALSPRALRFTQVLVFLAVLLWLIKGFFDYGYDEPAPVAFSPPVAENRPRHPIDDLHQAARQEFADLLGKQTFTLEAAEAEYLARRGRRPPPGFDKWFHYAQTHDTVIVEDFFDRIYHDLNPFWAIPPVDIRRPASDWFFRISIRGGNVTSRQDTERPWLSLWTHLISHVSEHLPDLDLMINEMDESRIVVPWETVNKHVEEAALARNILPVEELITNTSGLIVPESEGVPPIDYGLVSNAPYWDLYVRGCHPESPARRVYTAETDFTAAPPLLRNRPAHSYEGYVQNWTLTRSPCDNPRLQGLHGSFVEPLSISTTDKMFPMFGGSKLPTNNEILLPAAMYWTDDPFYSGGAGHGGIWADKQNTVMWRGAASGGRNREENWTRFQRHRFLSMLNSTNVAEAEKHESATPPNFVLPEPDQYDLSFDDQHPMSKWLGMVTDTAFVHLLCFPDDSPPFCKYTDPHFRVEGAKPMTEQYHFKYLPDLDGNSFSGRYRAFLGSTSLPIKATIYSEWHDSRLIPWMHFVPMDNTFIDIYGILEYFLGSETRAGHDDVAEEIAMQGKSWAEKVLRREDMVVYVFRLLLEYARLCDDNRDKLGWASGLA